jgi:hypothetical protein
MAKEFTGVYEITTTVDGVRKTVKHKITGPSHSEVEWQAWTFAKTMPGELYLLKLVASAYN